MNRVPNDLEFWETSRKNNWAFNHYYNMFVELFCSRWQYDDLPDTIKSRLVELILFTDGKILAFKDEQIGELAMRFTGSAGLNIWREPIQRYAIADNASYTATRGEDNSVIIYNNKLRRGCMQVAIEFATRLSNLDRAIDVNANAQKTPVLILCNENQRLTMKNLYKSYSGNEPFIFGDKNLDVKGAFQVLRTDAPYVADKLYTLKTQIFNEMLTYLGISNVNTIKKERLITDEVTRQLGGVMAQRMAAEEMRQEGWEAFNKMFGTNVKVSFKEDIEYIANDILNNQNFGGQEGGEGDE